MQRISAACECSCSGRSVLNIDSSRRSVAWSQRTRSQRRVTVAAAAVEFAKYQGLGNDFILVNRHALRYCRSYLFVAMLPGLLQLTRVAQSERCVRLRRAWLGICETCISNTRRGQTTRRGMMQVDNRSQNELMVTAEQAVALCNRNFGIGGDGVRPL